MNDDFPAGMVWLVGAGPGDPELLTRKAERLLGDADIIFYDALVSEGVLALAPETAERVSVGKRSGRHSKAQGDIDALIVAAALAGKRVVRLKGGDPAIFGRATEELIACRNAGVPVRICPGITAASAAAASHGMSLTLRGLARKLIFATAHAREGVIDGLDWSALADRDATLAIYMGKAAVAQVTQQLIMHGLTGETPVLVAANVSRSDEQLIRTRLDLLPIATRAVADDAPVVLLIGASVGQGGAASGAAAKPARQTAAR